MNDKQKKRGPGRPRKYETAAERKRAYRERKKKRLAEMQKTVAKLEEKVESMSVTDAKNSQMQALLKEISVHRSKFSPSEIAEMDNSQLLELRDLLRNWLEGYNNPIISQLQKAIIPRTYITFSDLGVLNEENEEEREPINYIPSIVETTQHNIKTNIRSFFATSSVSSGATIVEIFEQIVLLYLVEAELTSRQREEVEDIAFNLLEERIKELETQIDSEQRISGSE